MQYTEKMATKMSDREILDSPKAMWAKSHGKMVTGKDGMLIIHDLSAEEQAQMEQDLGLKPAAIVIEMPGLSDREILDSPESQKALRAGKMVTGKDGKLIIHP